MVSSVEALRLLQATGKAVRATALHRILSNTAPAIPTASRFIAAPVTDSRLDAAAVATPGSVPRISNPISSMPTQTGANQIAARHRRTEELKNEIAAAGAAIIADETPTERRAELLLNIAAMAEEQGTLGEEIQALEVERARREADLYSYRQTLAFTF
jgi:hypothetical protein